MSCKTQNTEWTHSFQVYRRAEQLCHFLFRNMSGSVFIPESTMFHIVSKMCDVLKTHEMPYRTPELLLRLQTGEEDYKQSGRGAQNRTRRFCKNHTDKPADETLYELYRAAEVFTAAFECGRLLCCDEDQRLPWSIPLVLELIQTAVSLLQAEGYPAEIPSEIKNIDNR